MTPKTSASEDRSETRFYGANRKLPPEARTGASGSREMSDDSRAGLTERQRTILEVIRASVTSRGYPPSIREIGAGISLHQGACSVFDHLGLMPSILAHGIDLDASQAIDASGKVLADRRLAVEHDLAGPVGVVPPAAAGHQRHHRDQRHDHQDGAHQQKDVHELHLVGAAASSAGVPPRSRRLTTLLTPSACMETP